MNTEQALRLIRKLWVSRKAGSYSEALKIAIQALEETQERENPQPLTLDELRQMDGEPVWLATDKDVLAAIVNSDGIDVELRTNRGVFVVFSQREVFDFLDSSFSAGVAKVYCHKPNHLTDTVTL